MHDTLGQCIIAFVLSTGARDDLAMLELELQPIPLYRETAERLPQTSALNFLHCIGQQLTLSKCFRRFRDNPVPSLDIDNFESREKLPDEGEYFVWHILAVGSPDEQRRLHEAGLARIFEREVSKVIKGFG